MQNDQIQRLIDVNPDPVIITERDSGCILLKNRAASFAIQPFNHLAAQPFILFDLIAPSEKEKLSSILNGKNRTGDFHFRMNSGTLILHKLYMDDFDDDKVIITFKDNSSFSPRTFQAEVIDNLNDAVIATNVSLEIIAWNKAAESIYGYTKSEAVGRNIRRLLQTEMTDAERKKFSFEMSVNGSVQWTAARRNKNGEPIFVEVNSITLHDDNGRVTGYVSVNRNITAKLQTLDKLSQYSSKLATIINNLPMVLLELDSEGKFILQQGKALAGAGFEPGQLLGSRFQDTLSKVKVTQNNGETIDTEEAYKRVMNGEVIAGQTLIADRHFDNYFVPVRKNDGKPTGLLGICLDITERVNFEKAAEAALKYSEEKYRLIVENANEGILLIDDKQQITFINSKLAQIVGRPKEELENKSVLEFVFEEDRENAEKYIRENAAGSRETFQFRLKNSQGSERWVRVNAVSVFDEQKRYAGGLALITDITEQRKAETEHHRLNELLRSLINYSPLSVIILDKNGKTKLWNPASERMFGWRSEEVLDKPVPFVPPDKREEHLALRNTVMGGESFPDREVVRVKKDGKKINVSIAASPLLDSDNNPIGISTFLVDVTEKRKSEREREKLFKQISAARNRLKILSAKLISVQENEKRNISRELHDEIGQLLTAIKIDVQRIKDGGNPEETMELADDCTKLVENTISVVRNLSLELRPAIIDDLGLAASLRWYLDKFRQRTGIEVKTEIKEVSNELPAECAITLFRICQEALTNIAKHAEAGYVKMSLNQNKRSVVLTIEDNGKGFDTQKALKQAARGKSLGLISMQERAELLGGRFSIKSAKGSGTIITASCQV